MATNITYHPTPLTRTERSRLRAQRGLTIWLTGLSASGKSTIATALETHLLRRGIAAYRLDGDNVRFGLNRDLGFSERDRGENIRRIAEVAKLFADSATVAITSFISPYRADRALARALHAAPSPSTSLPSSSSSAGPTSSEIALPFIEVFIDVPLAVAEARDPKGLYKRARAGEIPDFTGVSAGAPYEAPEEAEVRIRSDECSVEEAVGMIVGFLEERGYLGVATEGAGRVG